MIVVVVGWVGMVVIETCLDDMPGFIGWMGSGRFFGIVLGVEDRVNGCHRWAVEWFF